MRLTGYSVGNVGTRCAAAFTSASGSSKPLPPLEVDRTTKENVASDRSDNGLSDDPCRNSLFQCPTASPIDSPTTNVATINQLSFTLRLRTNSPQRVKHFCRQALGHMLCLCL